MAFKCLSKIFLVFGAKVYSHGLPISTKLVILLFLTKYDATEIRSDISTFQ